MRPQETRGCRKSTTPRCGTVTSIGPRFAHVRKQIELLEALLTQRQEMGVSMDSGELRLEAFRDELFGELEAISRIAISTPALNRGQLELKARLFLDYCVPEDDGDLAHELSRSICRDILGGTAKK